MTTATADTRGSDAITTPEPRRRSVGLLAAVVLLAALLALSIMVGATMMAPSAVWEALVHPSADFDQFTIRDFRIPRTVVGLVVGAALGVAGALIQALTRNPLADTGILGVGAGSSFAVAVAVGVLGIRDIRGYMWFAYAGALIVTIAVLALGSTRRGQSPMLMVLAGVCVSAVLTGATSALTLTNPEAFDQMRGWEAGSILGRPLSLVWPVLPLLAVALGLSFVMTRALNAMALGDELAASQGVRLGHARVLTVIAITLLAGGAIAIAGPIGFVGLMVPHVARWFVGPHQGWIFAYSVVLAPSLLLASDILGRLVMSPGEIPVGIVTAFLGAPVLIALVRRTRASGL